MAVMKKLGFSVLAFVLVLGAIEIVARLAHTVRDDRERHRLAAPEQWLTYSPTVGWEKKPGYKGSLGLADREFDAQGYFTADSDEVDGLSGHKRVIFIGDSNTFGWGASTPESFVEVTESLLPGVDAINLGVVGYSSYQGRKVLEKYLPLLKPDLVVVSFNFNDRRYVPHPGAIDGSEEFQRVYEASHGAVHAITGLLEMSHLYRGLRLLMRKLGVAPSPDAETDVRGLAPRVDEASYRQNLSEIATETKRVGVPLLFVLLRDDPLLSEHLKKGVARFEAGDYDAASAYLNSALWSHPMFRDLARVYLAKVYQAQGEDSKAQKVAATPSMYRSFSGGTLIRLDTEYNEIMRQVAADNAVSVLDGAAVLEERPSVFVDFCHFNPDGHRRLAELLAARISNLLAQQKAGTLP